MTDADPFRYLFVLTITFVSGRENIYSTQPEGKKISDDHRTERNSKTNDIIHVETESVGYKEKTYDKKVHDKKLR